MQFLNALSCTPTVTDWLTSSRQPRILHVFNRVCNLINERREVLSIVTTEIGDGPFNLVVSEKILFSEHCDAEAPITIYHNSIQLGDLFIDMEHAQPWNPRPDWKALHDKRNQIIAQVKQLPDINFQFSNSLASSLLSADLDSTVAGAKQLAGLGIGLTPSGDDFIMGALFAAWIIHPFEVAQTLAIGVADEASALTTSLSAAWLRSTGRGEAGILWHEFFHALISADTIQIHFTMNKILAVGETSGADALAGFTHSLISSAEHEHHVVSKFL